ncbi:MAG: 30S ribosomal protein S16 [Micromonosporaceae bacterium]
MAVRIRLMRTGKIRNPQYRIVIADSRKKRDGRAIEQIGLYHPKEEPSRIEVNSERAQHWLSVGAQPSEPVQRLLELTGDWQKFKGLPAPPPLKVAAPKADKHALYEAEAKSVLAADEAKAEKAKTKKPAKKAARSDAKAEKVEAKAEKADAKAEKADAKAEKPAAEAKKATTKAAKAAKSEEKAGADAGAES